MAIKCFGKCINQFSNIVQTLRNRVEKTSLESNLVCFPNAVSAAITKYKNHPIILTIKKIMIGIEPPILVFKFLALYETQYES